MPNFNQVILAGHITRDPELRYTPKGAAVVDFGIAINRSWENSNGEKQDEVTFVDITAWEKRAEVIAEYLKKGDPILVRGRLSTEQWEDKNTGQKRSRLKVILDEFQFLKSGDPNRTQPPKPKPAQSKFPPRRQAADDEGPAWEDDSIPF